MVLALYAYNLTANVAVRVTGRAAAEVSIRVAARAAARADAKAAARNKPMMLIGSRLLLVYAKSLRKLGVTPLYRSTTQIA